MDRGLSEGYQRVIRGLSVGYQSVISGLSVGYQCTMLLSMEIRDSKVLKSKCPVFAQFWSKSDNFSFDWWTTVQILEEKYLHQIFAKNVVSIGKKPVPGVS